MSLFKFLDLVGELGGEILALRRIIAQVNEKSSFLQFHVSCMTRVKRVADEFPWAFAHGPLRLLATTTLPMKLGVSISRLIRDKDGF